MEGEGIKMRQAKQDTDSLTKRYAQEKSNDCENVLTIGEDVDYLLVLLSGL